MECFMTSPTQIYQVVSFSKEDKQQVTLGVWRITAEKLREIARIRNESLTRILLELADRELKELTAKQSDQQ